jgi:hypothetical protein
MIRRLTLAAVLLASAAGLSACVVAEPGGYGRCPGHWVPAHYGPEGGFHPGHCA